MNERIVIRSYRRVFDVDRRIYRVDRWTLPVPGGVPLRGLGYFVATVLAVIVGGQLPVLGVLVDALSPPLRYVVLPLLVAMVATQAAPDGRAAHRFAWDWLRLRLRARRRCAGRIVPREGEAVAWHGQLGVAWDRHGAELHAARVEGPVRVTFRVPVRFEERGRRLIARAGWDEPVPAKVVISGGVVLEVRP